MTNKKSIGWILVTLAAARVYYENGMSSSSSSTTNSLLSALDFGGSGQMGGFSLLTGLIAAGGLFILLKK